MYNNVEEAIHFMVKAFKGQKLKTENIDRSFHSMIVYTLLRDITDTEDVLVSALLHDVINDTEYGYEEIEEKFGTLVADMVSDLSEDMSIAKWLDRKKDYIRRMRANYDVMVINIMLADKLHILLSNYNLFLKVGDKVWKTTGGSKDDNRWLYRETYNIAKKKGANKQLLDRYHEMLKIYFGDMDEED
ncbi:MAG: bifunctional (p)ppGpp synthetase/guanosine-3',5'-bis(diphosphate) 3'-pyrophosphohydrolase [Bacilli bacterium]|nr:bifunctional (p)ppGpp synthetase/guanosine-3',5'-bis(diphosphate) 3'-pyrophosphohydrolase [Bacilli bacterium]